ncbi:hypothetical protein DTL42_01760 [Bremerella cremea]|uniref:ATPase BadF/BadG/BcrA/BcrD type domain-containing protein n=1 Tax=Bremerella cremea TaxID=1031537 RepID=A0A368KU61_9BACT|nr:BadF/BadG/BcrA/BcrD ATPase family protein [Bremerella cremea]RCS53919.1 hypothetical protein DTL42_01760 [Bremerella cremea]
MSVVPLVLPDQLVLAVDGGGTKTACCLARVLADGQWQILANGQAGPSNPRAVGLEQAAEAIQSAVNTALSAANCQASDCRQALFSIAGTLDTTVRAALTEQLYARKLAAQLAVVPDLYPLLDNATAKASFGLIAGTGSVGIGRNAKNQLAITGGWGHILGDDGSGFAIGREALRYTLNTLETTGQPHGLATVICELWNVTTAYQLKTCLAKFNDLKAEVAQLSKVVVEQAKQLDMTAVGILLKAADDLTSLVQQLRIRLEVPENEISIRVSGGLFQSDGFFLEVLHQSLTTSGLQPTLQVLTNPTHGVLELLVSGFQPEQYELLP